MTSSHVLPWERFVLLSLREVASLLHVAPITVHRLVARRALPVYRFARRLLFRRDEVLAWLDRHRRESREIS